MELGSRMSSTSPAAMSNVATGTRWVKHRGLQPTLWQPRDLKRTNTEALLETANRPKRLKRKGLLLLLSVWAYWILFFYTRFKTEPNSFDLSPFVGKVSENSLKKQNINIFSICCPQILCFVWWVVESTSLSHRTFGWKKKKSLKHFSDYQNICWWIFW